MVKVIMGKRGSGKTKQVIELVNTAVNAEKGNVVCVEKGQNLRFNIKNSAKLIDISEYDIKLSYDGLMHTSAVFTAETTILPTFSSTAFTRSPVTMMTARQAHSSKSWRSSPRLTASRSPSPSATTSKLLTKPLKSFFN